MSENKHTPGPWKINTPRTLPDIIGADGETIGKLSVGATRPGRANAARIVACVNACEGIKNPAAISDAVGLISRLHERMEADNGSGVNPYELTQFPCEKTTWLLELRAALAKLNEAPE